MRKTKIVCTIGPASCDKATVTEMIKSGMNVARFNFSHGTHEYHKDCMDTVKKVRSELSVPVAIMLDTKGPEVRIGRFDGGKALLEDNSAFTLTTRQITGNPSCVSVTYEGLPSQVNAGDTVLLNDGLIELRVESCTDTDINCTVIHGGEITDRKGVNVPCIHLNLPVLSQQDKSDILFGIQNDIDFIAASFVRTPEDVTTLRKFIDYNGGHDIKIISKIENLEGIENFDAILKLSDGIMVARGDMGVEVAFERLPGLQKQFIKKCYQSGKMVITATQMLESMIENPNPTRAEITDVANAVFDGTSATMLSGETAIGENPVEAIRVMARIAEQAEKDAFEMNVYKGVIYEMDTGSSTNAVCDAACTTARDIKAAAIVAPTKYGQTARLMSKFRPIQPIVAATPVEKTYNQLALSWGVYPVIAIQQSNSDELMRHAIDCAKQIDIVKDGDIVVIAAGIPLDTPGNTNTIRIAVAGQKY